jgi:hypothetical protein
MAGAPEDPGPLTGVGLLLLLSRPPVRRPPALRIASTPVNMVEPPVWQFVSNLLEDPAKVRVGLDALKDQERRGMHGDPSREVKAWLDKLAEADRGDPQDRPGRVGGTRRTLSTPGGARTR